LVVHAGDPVATIRRADLDDIPALARLRWEWRTVERGEYRLSRSDFEAAFLQWWSAHQHAHVAYIAEQDGAAIGMAWLAIFDRIPQPRELTRLAGNVQSVFVLEGARNHGIGAALIDAVIAEARVRGLGYLIVHPSERAYPLYERLGFAQTDTLLHLALDKSATATTRE
jgi:GNAT superfamily N-acetyltransferase